MTIHWFSDTIYTWLLVISLNQIIAIKKGWFILTRSTFPQQIDQFAELYDLPPSLTVSAKRYQELKMKPTLNASEQQELNNLSVELGNYIITPETWNKFADAVVNVETFFKEQVDGYILAKQEEWSSFVESFRSAGEYSDAIAYKFQNMVTYNGDLYLCLKDTVEGTNPTNAEFWQKISTKGDKGDIGLNLYLKGDYNESTVYAVGDAVIFNGVLFYCIQETTAGIDPTNSTYWFLYDRTIVSASAPTITQQGLIWIEEVE